MFGFEHSLEAYVPAPKRVHGYYTMPLLARGRLVGRVDPARSGRTLVARRLSLDTPWAAEAMARALAEAAAWVGCDSVEVGHVVARRPGTAAAQGAIGPYGLRPRRPWPGWAGPAPGRCVQRNSLAVS